MSKRTLDRVCAKRLRAPDFAQATDYQPTSKFEIAIIVFMILVAIALIAIQAFAAYFA